MCFLARPIEGDMQKLWRGRRKTIAQTKCEKERPDVCCQLMERVDGVSVAKVSDQRQRCFFFWWGGGPGVGYQHKSIF